MLVRVVALSLLVAGPPGTGPTLVPAGRPLLLQWPADLPEGSLTVHLTDAAGERIAYEEILVRGRSFAVPAQTPGVWEVDYRITRPTGAVVAAHRLTVGWSAAPPADRERLQRRLPRTSAGPARLLLVGAPPTDGFAEWLAQALEARLAQAVAPLGAAGGGALTGDLPRQVAAAAPTLVVLDTAAWAGAPAAALSEGVAALLAALPRADVALLSPPPATGRPAGWAAALEAAEALRQRFGREALVVDTARAWWDPRAADIDQREAFLTRCHGAAGRTPEGALRLVDNLLAELAEPPAARLAATATAGEGLLDLRLTAGAEPVAGRLTFLSPGLPADLPLELAAGEERHWRRPLAGASPARLWAALQEAERAEPLAVEVAAPGLRARFAPGVYVTGVEARLPLVIHHDGGRTETGLARLEGGQRAVGFTVGPGQETLVDLPVTPRGGGPGREAMRAVITGETTTVRAVAPVGQAAVVRPGQEAVTGDGDPSEWRRERWFAVGAPEAGTLRWALRRGAEGLWLAWTATGATGASGELIAAPWPVGRQPAATDVRRFTLELTEACGERLLTWAELGVDPTLTARLGLDVRLLLPATADRPATCLGAAGERWGELTPSRLPLVQLRGDDLRWRLVVDEPEDVASP